ncbi:MAG: VapE domain-containing protein [Polaromonas sp.]
MMPREPLPPIKYKELAHALLARASTLVPMWLPGGVQRGHEYICGSVQGGAGSSCAVNLTSGKWGDFESGQQGNDLVGLYAACFDLSMGKAALQVAREEGLEDVAGVQPARGGTDAPRREPRPVPPPAPRKAEAEGWKTMMPVPDNAPAPTFWHFHRNNLDKPESLSAIDHLAEYRMDGQLLGYVVRFIDSKGDKETLPYTWCISERDGSCKWTWKTWDEPRPLYIPAQAMPAGRTVVLVEGEKKACALHALLEARCPGVYLVVSWVGGCNGWKKALWDWLKGCTVLLWPDCDAKREKLTSTEAKAFANDEAGLLAKKAAQAAKPLLPAYKQPGMAAMLGIGALLRADHGCTVQLLPIPAPGAVVDGWDCADAIHTDGWDADKVLAFFGRAHALPGETDARMPAAAGGQGGGGGGKKIDGPVGTGDGDMDGEGFSIIGGRRIPAWLVPYYDKANKRWLASRKMVILILERDVLLSCVLAYNELSNNVQSRVLWPWPHSQVGDVTDAVDLLLGKYLTDTYGLPSISRAALMEAIQTVAHTRRFHPIREELAGLVWDGKKRIDKWLVHVLGEAPDKLSPAMLEYLQIVGRCWLLGMVNRVMQPGCKFDYCPVLEGMGGLRKSTMVEILGSTKYYSDTPFEVGRGKEAQEQVQGLWVYEIAEMTHFSKSEVGAIKAFISSKVDRYRVAYGATVGSFARQCILVGTTNENTYLRDRTGNRRFWPIPVKHVINTEWLVKYRDQLLAEAYALYGEGTAYTPTADQERRLFEPMQESRLVETAVVSELLHLLTRAPQASGIGAIVNDLTSFVTIAQLTLALGIDAAKSSPALEAQIRGWLDHEGWERVKKQINGARAWGYVRPSTWPPQDDDVDMTVMPVVSPSVEDVADDEPF